jgi:hypothetical protein
MPPRWAFEEVERLYAEHRNVIPNDLNVDVVMRNPIGWAMHHCFAAYIEQQEAAETQRRADDEAQRFFS